MARPTLLAAALTSGLPFSQMPWYARLLLGLAALAVVGYELTLRYRLLVKLAEKVDRVDSRHISHIVDAFYAATKSRRRATPAPGPWRDDAPGSHALRAPTQSTSTAAASDPAPAQDTD